MYVFPGRLHSPVSVFPGRLHDARELCRQCGQPWRAASLGGAGAFGPLPVGVAAAQQASAWLGDEERMDPPLSVRGHQSALDFLAAVPVPVPSPYKFAAPPSGRRHLHRPGGGGPLLGGQRGRRDRPGAVEMGLPAGIGEGRQRRRRRRGGLAVRGGAVRGAPSMRCARSCSSSVCSHAHDPFAHMFTSITSQT